MREQDYARSTGRDQQVAREPDRASGDIHLPVDSLPVPVGGIDGRRSLFAGSIAGLEEQISDFGV